MIWEADDGRVRCVHKSGAMKTQKWKKKLTVNIRRSREEETRESKEEAKNCGFEFVGHFIKMGYNMVYNYGKGHHLVFHILQI